MHTPVIYIVLYGFFSAYPLVFSSHGLSQRTVGLTFLPVIGGFLVVPLVSYFHFLRYRHLVHDAKRGLERRGIYKGKVEPEERLVPSEFSHITIFLYWHIALCRISHSLDTSAVSRDTLPRRVILVRMDIPCTIQRVDPHFQVTVSLVRNTFTSPNLSL